MQMIFRRSLFIAEPTDDGPRYYREPLVVNGVSSRSERQDRVEELLRMVHLPPEYMNRHPHA
ncbi:MAG: hypothetical protein R2867_05595 [Caldilineaceae bacterium]